MITENQARILAHALHEIRPAWGIDATLKVLERNADHPSPFADIIAAAVMAARDPETLTPGRIFQVSIHWPEDAKRKLPRAPDCADHVGQDAYTCRSCKADVLCGDRPPDMVGKHYEKPIELSPEALAIAGAFVMEGTK